MTREQIIKAFNEWMRQYVDDPAAFANTMVCVRKFLDDTADGREPSYGEECVAFLEHLNAELNKAN